MSLHSTPAFATEIETAVAAAMAEHGPSMDDVRAFERGFETWLIQVEAIGGFTVDAGADDGALSAYEEGVRASDYALQLKAGSVA